VDLTVTAQLLVIVVISNVKIVILLAHLTAATAPIAMQSIVLTVMVKHTYSPIVTVTVPTTVPPMELATTVLLVPLPMPATVTVLATVVKSSVASCTNMA
jgi:hypothetical protein